jgi:hypothetical protein
VVHKRKEAAMTYTFFAVCAYIFMRAFEVLFQGQKEKGWYKVVVRIIGCGVLYAAVAAMLVFYFDGLHLLGFETK